MDQETTPVAAPRLPGRGGARPVPGGPREPTTSRSLLVRDQTARVLWDELAPGLAGPWPAGGTVLFLWPQLRGDRRRPAWARGDDEAQDENDPWWNGEDSKVAAALLRPFCDGLLAFLAERAGPPRFQFGERFEAVRASLRRLQPGHPLRAIVGAYLARPAPLDQLVTLVEGAGEVDRSACTVSFGAPAAAVLHARRGERCLWLWMAHGFRATFDRLGDEAAEGARFQRCVMDWSQTGRGRPAPRPPRSLRLTA